MISRILRNGINKRFLTHTHTPTNFGCGGCKKDVKYDMLISDIQNLKEINTQLTTGIYVTMVSSLSTNFVWVYYMVVHN